MSGCGLTKALLRKSMMRKSTKISKGNEHSNGVQFSYNLKTKEWFGTYTLRINRRMIDERIPRVTSPVFEVGGHRWFVVTRCTGDFFGVSLWSDNDKEVDAHHTYTLLHKRSSQNIVKSGRGNFSPASRFWGFPQLIEISKLEALNSGFVHLGSLHLEIAIRVVTPQNENFTVSCSGKKATCTWRLFKVHDMGSCSLRSEDFKIGDTRWSLTAYPKATDGKNDDFGLYLWHRGKSVVTASYEFSTTNHRSSYIIHTFSPGQSWGWPTYLSVMESMYASLGYLGKDGWLTVTAKITILDDDHVEKMKSQPQPSIKGLCLNCGVHPRTCGVLHGETAHKCYCVSCAQMLSSVENVKCPICHEKAERIIKQFS